MAATKPVKGVIKFRVGAGKATPAPPVGCTLGANGVNMMDFINAFNDATRELGDQMLSVKVTIYEDRTFTFTYKGETGASLIRKAAGLEKGWYPEQDQGRPVDARPSHRTRRNQAQGHECQQHGSRREDHRRPGPFHGYRDRRLDPPRFNRK